MHFHIRLEKEADYREVEVLTREAFWNLYRPGCDEHFLVHTMRGHDDFMGDLAYVAQLEQKIVGSIMFTKSSVTTNEKDEVMETLTFGPLCVHPACQRKGIGTALIHHTRKIAIQKGYPAIIILGDPHNYCKHGFKNGKDVGIAAADGRYPLGLLVLELREGIFGNHQWKFKESAVYDLNQRDVDEFDKRFEYKQKKYQYSQELFSMMIRAFVE